jgi:hypothetical protein
LGFLCYGILIVSVVVHCLRLHLVAVLGPRLLAELAKVLPLLWTVFGLSSIFCLSIAFWYLLRALWRHDRN